MVKYSAVTFDVAAPDALGVLKTSLGARSDVAGGAREIKQREGASYTALELLPLPRAARSSRPRESNATPGGVPGRRCAGLFVSAAAAA